MLRKLTFAAALLAATALSRRGERKDVRLLLGSFAGRSSTRESIRAATPSMRPPTRSTTACCSSSRERPSRVAALAESWTKFPMTACSTRFKLRPGVKFHTTEFFTPDP